ncbi:MAG TPA: polysaccharide deacetylase family protein [Nitrospira sp.]|nr:polysaccharide deacetylase family protein [Nitrospira sp.]
MSLQETLSIRLLLFAVLFSMAMPASGEAQVITSGSPSCPAVALTFDLCPVRGGGGYDGRLIDYLIEHRIPATFFMSGKWIAKHDEHVKKLLNVPFFEIGTHGEVHAHLPMQSAAEQEREIVGPVRLLRTKYDRSTSLFRPPYGEYNDETVDVVHALGLRFVMWNVVSGDPDPTLSAEQIERRLERLTRKGSIIVMHANGKGQHTYEAVAHLYEQWLPQHHLEPMTVSEILTCRRSSP